jgi:hypothetical protein
MENVDFNQPNARSTDPETSHEAAKDAAFRATEHCVLALKMLHRFGPLTDFELASRTGLQQTSIGKRRKDCQDAGLVTGLCKENGEKVKRPAPSGSSALVWTLTDKGNTWLTSSGHSVR